MPRRTMRAWGRVGRTLECEERGVALSGVQAAAVMLLLLSVLSLNLQWRFERPEPTMDVVVFDQEFAAPKPPEELPQPKQIPIPKVEPPPPPPKPEKKPEKVQAELGTKPEPEEKKKEEEPPPEPEPEPEPAPEPTPEPEPVPDLSEIIEEIEAAEPPPPDPELIDIYRNRFRSLIERHLRTPEGVPADANVVLLVLLRKNGTLDGDPAVIESSGHPAYDNEAVRAVIFAQPYPMPREPVLLEEFRELRLSIQPRGR